MKIGRPRKIQKFGIPILHTKEHFNSPTANSYGVLICSPPGSVFLGFRRFACEFRGWWLARVARRPLVWLVAGSCRPSPVARW